MEYEVKKLFQGYASVRDYIVKKCIARNEDLVILYQDERMIVPLKVLKNPEQIHKTKFKSKYDESQEYELYDFLYKPGKNLQSNIFDIL